MSASRQRQSSHVSHENVTQSTNPFQHYLQGSGTLTSLASASPMLSMLMRPHHPPDETLTLPPHLLPHHSLRFHPPLPSLPLCSVLPKCLQHSLPSLCSRSALPTCSQHCLPSFRSRSALLTCSQHCLPSLCLRSALPTCS
ncbi:hypothetical protein O181_066721 [Austropuccinia psidii MF-1]|uniref:Uncharacterized protein n=1 Tax=Austropuccinia psidii MF-1 TaxID=1389203 RepID=A0A9Q3I2F3_9BASI|nr:hypothetical protein [Austropuccinia psidii MF-1]